MPSTLATSIFMERWQPKSASNAPRERQKLECGNGPTGVNNGSETSQLILTFSEANRSVDSSE